MTLLNDPTAKIDGKEYEAVLSVIDRTSFGWEDHGILTAYLMTSSVSGSTGIGVGGYCLDTSSGSPDYKRLPTLFGLAHVMKIMKTVGVREWEALKGKQIYVLFEKGNKWGGRAVGILSQDGNRHFILQELADEYKDEA